MKRKLFTHTDLDGVGCAIVGKLAFGDSLDVTFCDYINVNETVKKFINNKEYNNYEFIYMTDMSVNQEVAELIESTRPLGFDDGSNLGNMFKLLDHHPTAEFLNQYFWAEVKTIDNAIGELTSGTKMFYNFLINNDLLSFAKYRSTYNFVEAVRKYDTWLWKTKYHDETPKQWNDLLYILGRKEFMSQMIYKLEMYESFDFNDFESMLLKVEQDKINKYVEEKNLQLIKYPLLTYNAGIVFAENYKSELGNKLAELNPDVDFIAIVDLSSSSISYRTIKDNINLGFDVARVFGGGGHPKAAGSEISEEIKNMLISFLFKDGKFILGATAY